MQECRLDHSSEDVREYIAQLIPENVERISQEERACVVSVTKQWDIIYSDLPSDRAFNVSGLGYFTIPIIYGLMDTSSMDASGITSTLNQPFLNVAGQGVIIGIVDTGIDYMSDSFRNSAGMTRIGALWDQTIHTSEEILQNQVVEGNRTDAQPNNSGAQTGRQVLYGQSFSKADIDDALRLSREGGNPYTRVNSQDELGHGTFLAGITAASQTEGYRGAAPEAELAVVKLRQAKQYLRDFFLIKDDVPAYAESDIMMGVRFLIDYANSQSKPLVLLVGLGTAGGARLGVSPLSEQLNDAAARKNTVVAVAMGNEANARTHYEGKAISDQVPDSIEINVSGEGKGFVMELWADSLDILTVAIVSPSGEQIPRIPVMVGKSSEFTFLLENSKVTVDYQTSGLVSGYEIIYLRFLTPAEGIWTVHVYSLTNIEGSYSAWLTLQQFMTSQVYFIRSTPETTLTGPAAAARVISVGAYDHITGATASFSGRGYTADERVKPELIAPGVNVYGPVPDNRFSNRTGTSISAAHVAGAAALLLCWGVYYGNDSSIGSNEIKLILLRGANRETTVSYPNPVSGYGRLNLIQSFYQMRIR